MRVEKHDVTMTSVGRSIGEGSFLPKTQTSCIVKSRVCVGYLSAGESRFC